MLDPPVSPPSTKVYIFRSTCLGGGINFLVISREYKQFSFFKKKTKTWPLLGEKYHEEKDLIEKMPLIVDT
jgi:hypothetical protein